MSAVPSSYRISRLSGVDAFKRTHCTSSKCFQPGGFLIKLLNIFRLLTLFTPKISHKLCDLAKQAFLSSLPSLVLQSQTQDSHIFCSSLQIPIRGRQRIRTDTAISQATA